MMRYVIRDTSKEMVDRQVGGGESPCQVWKASKFQRALKNGKIGEKMGKDGIGGKGYKEIREYRSTTKSRRGREKG
jgi:hypothetical protein